MAKVMTDLEIRLSAQIADLKKDLNKASGQLKSFEKKTEKGSNKIAGAFKSMGPAIAGAFAVAKLAQFGKQLLQLALEAEGVETAFKKITNSERVLVDLKKATKGTVSELELMKQAITAQNFNIPLDALAKGLAFATQRAADTGQSVDYLVNSFTVGLGRKSILILDNLGISALELKEAVKETGDFAAGVAVVIDKNMAGYADQVETADVKLKRMNATLEDTKLLAGKVLLEGFAPFIDKANFVLKLRTGEFYAEAELAAEQAQKLVDILEQLNTSGSKSDGTFDATSIEEQSKALERLNKQFPGFLKNIAKMELTYEQIAEIAKVGFEIDIRIDKDIAEDLDKALNLKTQQADIEVFTEKIRILQAQIKKKTLSEGFFQEGTLIGPLSLKVDEKNLKNLKEQFETFLNKEDIKLNFTVDGDLTAEGQKLQDLFESLFDKEPPAATGFEDTISGVAEEIKKLQSTAETSFPATSKLLQEMNDNLAPGKEKIKSLDQVNAEIEKLQKKLKELKELGLSDGSIIGDPKTIADFANNIKVLETQKLTATGNALKEINVELEELGKTKKNLEDLGIGEFKTGSIGDIKGIIDQLEKVKIGVDPGNIATIDAAIDGWQAKLDELQSGNVEIFPEGSIAEARQKISELEKEQLTAVGDKIITIGYLIGDWQKILDDLNFDGSVKDLDKLTEGVQAFHDEVLKSGNDFLDSDSIGERVAKIKAGYALEIAAYEEMLINKEIALKDFITKEEQLNAQKEEEIQKVRIAGALKYMEVASSLATGLADIVEAQKQRELSAVGNNAKKREKIEEAYAKKQKALAIIEAIINTAVGVTAAIPIVPLMIAAGVAGAAAVAIIASQPLAEGGIAYGPTNALIGEYSNARTNPEVVAPLNKLQGMLGGTNGGKYEFIIDGTQLVGVLQKQETQNTTF